MAKKNQKVEVLSTTGPKKAQEPNNGWGVSMLDGIKRGQMVDYDGEVYTVEQLDEKDHTARLLCATQPIKDTYGKWVPIKRLKCDAVEQQVKQLAAEAGKKTVQTIVSGKQSKKKNVLGIRDVRKHIADAEDLLANISIDYIADGSDDRMGREVDILREYIDAGRKYLQLHKTFNLLKTC